MEFRDALKRGSGKRIVISPHDAIMKNLLKWAFGVVGVE
jgi:hypothetical protein